MNNECCPYWQIVLFWGGCVSGGRVVAHQSEGWWFDSRQDTEPQLALGASSNRVCMVIAPDEQVAPCMVASVTRVWMCLWKLTCVVRRGRCYLITVQLLVKLKWFYKYWKKHLWHFPILAMIGVQNPKICRLWWYKTKEKQQILTVEKEEPEDCWHFIRKLWFIDEQNSCRLIFCQLTYWFSSKYISLSFTDQLTQLKW